METDFAWLIETVFKTGHPGPFYYTLHESGGMAYWTADPNEATRFARKKDAVDMIDCYNIPKCNAVEHGWG